MVDTEDHLLLHYGHTVILLLFRSRLVTTPPAINGLQYYQEVYYKEVLCYDTHIVFIYM